MKNKVIIFAALVIFVVAVSGCATSRKQTDLEMQGLKNQISTLQTELQTKDEEIAALKESSNRVPEERVEGPAQPMMAAVSQKSVSPEAKSRFTLKQVQIALKNAGYDPGPVDGRMGKQTRDAIKAFQRSNNLKADGMVGKRTWSLLREYLTKKVK